jgi:hypothetical protein
MANSDRATGKSSLPSIDSALARRIVEDSIRRYFAKRRARIPEFTDRTYSLKGAAALHSHALGHDLWRAPLNIVMAGPQLGVNLTANYLARKGRRREAQVLKSRELFFRTSVADAIERAVLVELMELPYSGPHTPSFRDALAVEILADKRLAGVLGILEGPWGEGERLRMDQLLTENLSIYLNARTATGELAGALVTLAAGGAALHQVTPGMVALGPALARAIAAHTGTTAAAVLAGGGILAASAVISAFSGILTDPLQRRLGLHQRRLLKLMDTLESGFLGGDARLAVHEQYAMRLIDVIDALAALAGHIRAVS